MADTLRWPRADAPSDQAALFDTPVFEIEPGIGEYRGLEFMHVRAKRIINEVKGDPYLPFRWTINAYRGCSHACAYCLSGETPVLMADGRIVPLAAVSVGDRVASLHAGRVVATDVIAHWSTERPAFRVVLEDGRELVASGEHRFLSEHGWRHVTAGVHAVRAGRSGTDRPKPSTQAQTIVLERRPSLAVGDRLVGAAGSVSVVDIEPLGIELPMYDITTGTGDFIANGVISHNCFARPTHAYLDLNIDEDFDRRIVVKVNAAARLRAELEPRRWAGEHIAMGTNTDPYQRAEGKYRLTRQVVEVLSERRNPFSILTKSTLVLRDLDVLAEAASRTNVRVNLSIGTLDEAVWKATEPGTPHPARRVEAVARLNGAGIPCGVLIAPVLPGLSDGDDQLRAVVEACVAAGAQSISTVLLHLRPGVRDVFMRRLAASHPELVGGYQRLYGHRAYAPKAEQQRIVTRVRSFVREAGGVAARGMDPEHMSGHRTAVAVHPRRATPAGVDQLRLL